MKETEKALEIVQLGVQEEKRTQRFLALFTIRRVTVLRDQSHHPSDCDLTLPLRTRDKGSDAGVLRNGMRCSHKQHGPQVPSQLNRRA